MCTVTRLINGKAAADLGWGGFPASSLGGDALSGASNEARMTVNLVFVVHSFVFNERISMVSMRVRDRESIQEAVRRFRKLVERSGLKRETRRRQFYEKPSQIKRRARLRAERRAVNARRASTRR